ncbi:MAG: peptidase T [Clostridia bacterium]|nr:peptidase T [Clostridia bacterium]
MRAYERLLQYVVIHTTSDDTTGTTPSTARQFNLARLLVEQMQALGVADAHVDDKCYVYGTLPATEGYENATRLGLIAHMDTAQDCSGENVRPQLWENYDGNDLTLPSGRVLDVASFPHLPGLKGRTLITSDGTTLLGADDKAGVAEIMTLLERLQAEHIPHGKLSIAFTPDEEIGEGADHFDVAKFGADFGYTVDGGAEGELEYENFNAAGAVFDIKGFSVHPGSAKDVMVNALLVACEINGMLPSADTPRYTEGYEGFYHITKFVGNIEQAQLCYIVRDHSADCFAGRLHTLRHIEKTLNERYGAGTVTLTIKEQYRNMKEKIEPCMHLIENAKRAAKAAGVEPKVVAIRGGTDGARLSFMGLPCPNLGTGGYAFHGPCEHITVEGMDIATQMLVELVKLYAARPRG